MAVTPTQSDVRRVRLKTTDSLEELPDEVILTFLSDTQDTLGLDYNAAIADCWEYLARSDHYMSQSVGNLSYAQPTAQRKAAYYRSISRSGGVSVVVGVLRRTDLSAPLDTDKEFDA